MNNETIQMYLMVINNSMARRSNTDFVMSENDYLFITDLMNTVKEYNALQRYIFTQTLKVAKKNAKDEIKQGKTE